MSPSTRRIRGLAGPCPAPGRSAVGRSEGSAHLYARAARTRRVAGFKRSSRKTASYWSVVSSS